MRCSIVIHAVVASLVMASACRDVPLERLEAPEGASSGVWGPGEATALISSMRPPPPPPPPPPTLISVPPPTSIRAAFSSANERPESWTATLYDLVPVRRRERRPMFATFAIKRTISVPTTRIDELVRWLSTEAGYVNDGYACCPLATPPNALGLRLTRGPVVLDLVIQCGRVALGAEPAIDEIAVEMGFLAGDVVQFLETLSKDCSD